MLRRCLLRIQEKTKISQLEFERDLDSQDIVVLNLERAVQLCVDMASHIIAHQDVRAPESMADSFEKLRSLGALDDEVCARMKKAAGFRNLAVHEYAELNFGIVYALATQHIEDFRDFVRQAERFCKENELLF